jgi:hypothetical protein
MKRISRTMIVMVVLVFVVSTATPAANDSAWRLMDASSARAQRTRAGITIGAAVMLPNGCYEAAVRPSPKVGNQQQYLVETRMKPSDIGKMCAMVIVPTTARGSFPMARIPTRIKVEARNKTFDVPVGRSTLQGWPSPRPSARPAGT